MTDPQLPSRAEITARKMKIVRGLLERRTQICDVKRIFAKEFSCTERTSTRFISKCYELLRLDSEKSTEELRADACAFYQSIIRDSANSTRDRMHAQERLDKILGLEAALKLRDTEPSVDAALPPNLSPAEVRAQVEAALHKAICGAPTGIPGSERSSNVANKVTL